VPYATVPFWMTARAQDALGTAPRFWFLHHLERITFFFARSLSDIRKHENFGACVWPRINDLDSATVI